MTIEVLEDLVSRLVRRFQNDPLHFFSERELHGEFFALGRSAFGTARAISSDVDLPLFRYEYNTLWRHRRARSGGSFENRSSTDGVAGSIDFAVLNADFVRSNDLLTVVNKNEVRRARSRMLDRPLDYAIELKMAHIRDALVVRRSAINELRRGVQEDCRKLAHEEPRRAYVLAFSHADGPSHVEACEILRLGTREFQRIVRSELPLLMLLATPSTTFLLGPWKCIELFPNTIVMTNATEPGVTTRAHRVD